ncbi:hypothetical protein HYX17_02470 [Candidatus Woesearchaeota archaeon]|nr:hypothetical protein [Candidatus Woesearchaeota archaeon]
MGENILIKGLKLLRENPEGLIKKELENELGKDKFYTEFLFFALMGKQEDHLIILNNKEKWILTKSGFDYLRQVELEENQIEVINVQKEQKEILSKQVEVSKEQTKIQSGQKRFMGLLIIVTLILGVLSYNIQIKQTEILEQTSVPNRAELFIRGVRTSGENIPTYHYSAFSDPNMGDIDIYIANVGRIPSGVVNLIGWENENWLDSSVLKEGYPTHFLNIESGGLNVTELKIKNISDVPLGVSDLILKYDCNFCEPLTNFINITICVYESSYGECQKLINEIK